MSLQKRRTGHLNTTARTTTAVVVLAMVASLWAFVPSAGAALTCAGKTVTVNLASGDKPTNGHDVIRGTNRAETINGLGGNDVICGMGGNDTINGGNGKDTIYGGGGNDTIDGGNQNDRLYGNSGRDSILGGSGNDVIRGGNDNDRADGGPGNDNVHGQAGNDVLGGGDGDDHLRGNDGVDWLYGGYGADDLDAGGEAPLEPAPWVAPAESSDTFGGVDLPAGDTEHFFGVAWQFYQESATNTLPMEREHQDCYFLFR